MCIQNPVKHLRWSLLRNKLSVISSSSFPQHAPSQILNRALNMPLQSIYSMHCNRLQLQIMRSEDTNSSQIEKLFMTLTLATNLPWSYHVQLFSLGQTRLTDETEKNVVKFINVFTDQKVLIDKMDLHVFIKTYLDKKGVIDSFER